MHNHSCVVYCFFLTVEYWSQDFEFSKVIANVNKETFGHSAFRPMQKEIINAVMHGKDCLVVMPTGAGKSLTFQVYTCFNVQLYFSLFEISLNGCPSYFQLPATQSMGLTVVISPLLSLMKVLIDCILFVVQF